ncbi:MAG TPA: hypothetical protein DHU55_11420 [Blastocatellia bacterium]|jgi:hypothetical protein|nr:hypothetical protein [Blastocatellia bacterium]HCX30355.1 hypothetical protein [Blastocatellia bacterium]
MIYSTLRRYIVTFFLILLLGVDAFAQNAEHPKPPDESAAKAEAIIQRAIEALGGSAYLNVQTVVGRGFFTTFHDGVSQIPARFLDYISYPNKERTEFTGDGIRVIQANTGETGWLFDGATRSLSDMKAPQIEEFKRSMRTSVENLLHGWWKKEGATLSYVGRREAGLARRNETVRLTYPDGFWIEYEFAAKEGLPAKVIYKRTKKKADSDETEEITEEDRLAKPITITGITAPWVIDHFSAGAQTSRVNYESVEYNRPLADTLFAKPASIKGLK